LGDFFTHPVTLSSDNFQLSDLLLLGLLHFCELATTVFSAFLVISSGDLPRPISQYFRTR
jgi:hypothetical protein